MRIPTPVANGLHTDHPIPGLPLVDDSLLPLEDPTGIAQIGRLPTEGHWGRADPYYDLPGAWRAFATDPNNPDLAWLVIHHPTNGTTVSLYRDDDASDAYTYRDFTHDGVIPLLVRAGGYWGDGDTWCRNTCMVDPVTDRVTWDTPERATSVTAKSVLDCDNGPTPDATIYDTTTVPTKAEEQPYQEWVAHTLSTWAQHRAPTALPLEKAVVTLQAPELEYRAMLDTPQVAKLVGIEPPTWRSYVSRGDAPAPARVATAGGTRHPFWSRPVIEAWVAERTRNSAQRSQEPVSVPEMASMLTSLQGDVRRLGRRLPKIDGPDAVRATLRGNIIGLSTSHQVPAQMHAAWMVDEYREDPNPGMGLSDRALDQLLALMWLDPTAATEAIRGYILRGVERGYSRELLEAAVLRTPQVRNNPQAAALAERAVTPYWR